MHGHAYPAMKIWDLATQIRGKETCKINKSATFQQNINPEVNSFLLICHIQVLLIFLFTHMHRQHCPQDQKLAIFLLETLSKKFASLYRTEKNEHVQKPYARQSTIMLHRSLKLNYGSNITLYTYNMIMLKNNELKFNFQASML